MIGAEELVDVFDEGSRSSENGESREKKRLQFSSLILFSPGLVQVAERGPDDLLDFSLVDVDAGAEGRGLLGGEGVGDEMMGAATPSRVISRRKRRSAAGEAAAATAVSAAGARECDANRTDRAYCWSRQHRNRVEKRGKKEKEEEEK